MNTHTGVFYSEQELRKKLGEKFETEVCKEHILFKTGEIVNIKGHDFKIVSIRRNQMVLQSTRLSTQKMMAE